MKTLIATLMIGVFGLSGMIVSDSAEAHSGRTDSNGGHNCSEQSKRKGLCYGYHYHRSYSLEDASYYSSKPNFNGGYDYYDYNGRIGSSKPNFNGGYDYYDYNGRIGSSKPNFNGGYDYKYGW